MLKQYSSLFWCGVGIPCLHSFGGSYFASLGQGLSFISSVFAGYVTKLGGPGL